VRFEAVTAASSIAEDSNLLEYDAMSLGKHFLMIRGIVVPSKYGELFAQQHSGISQKAGIFSVKGMSHETFRNVSFLFPLTKCAVC
jgi:hypothetical protein